MKFIEKKAHELYISSSGLSKSADQFGFGYPFLAYTDIFNNYYAPDELTTLVNSTEKDREKYSVERGDVFLTRTSETTEELGMSCVALKTYPNSTFNGFAKRLRPITDEVVPEYAAYYFRSPYFRGQCMSMASLITRASLNDSMISRLKIRYPKKKEDQTIIGEILMNYDNLINNNTKRIKLLERMIDNLYREWFVRFRFPGYERCKFETGIPTGWSLCKLEDIISIDRGLSYSSDEIDCDEGIDLINLKNIQSFGGFRIDGTKKYSGKYKNEQIVKTGDLIMGVTDMTQDRRTVGSVALIPILHGTSVITADLIKINSDTSKVFLYSLFRYGNVSRYISQFANGANVLHLRPQIIKRIKVYLPDNKIIQKYSEIIEPIINEINLLNEKNSNLIKQKELLLPRFMSGKLEIK